MQLSRLCFTSMLALTITWSFAQSSVEFTGPLPKEPARQVRAPVARHGIFSPRHQQAFHYKKQKVTHSAQYEFYKRVELAAKEHQRMLKELSKPQYSNFLYYGHKRMPKKHPPEKMRYCGECGIRH